MKHPQHPNPTPEQPASNRECAVSDFVCVTLQRPPHFWRFACSPDQTGDLLEHLAESADNPNKPLTWADAELIASEIVVHHQSGTPSDGLSNDR